MSLRFFAIRIIVATFIILNCFGDLSARTLKDSLGFIDVRGAYERLSWNSNSWSIMGGGFSLALNFRYPIYLEAYLDYFQHINPLNNLDSSLITSKSMNSMHVGGKTVLVVKGMFLFKAGMGLANIKSQINGRSTTGNDFEINLSAGMYIPLTSTIDCDFSFIFRRLFETPSVNLIGGSTGVMFKF